MDLKFQENTKNNTLKTVLEDDIHVKAYLDFLYNEHKQPECSCASKMGSLNSPLVIITDEFATWLREFEFDKQ